MNIHCGGFQFLTILNKTAMNKPFADMYFISLEQMIRGRIANHRGLIKLKTTSCISKGLYESDTPTSNG